jgi:hypothetical protein
MTELEWLSCREPQAMLQFLRDGGKLSDRKARLFAVAVCRRIWHLMTDGRSRQSVEVVERWADGEATAEEAEAAKHAAWEVVEDDTACRVCTAAWYAGWPEAWKAACFAADHAAWEVAWNVSAYGESDKDNGPVRDVIHDAEQVKQVDLLRDLVGPLPFRPVVIPPAVLRWQEGTVVRLAQAAYDRRRMPAGELEEGRLAILADALEESGCTAPEVLGHLRESGGVHVRGCWVIDALTGRS